MKYVIMYYYAIFWVLRRVTRFSLFNNILHSLLLFKKKHRKINIWIRHNFEAIGRISTKRLHTSSYMYSSPGWIFRVWRLHTICNGKNPNIYYFNTCNTVHYILWRKRMHPIWILIPSIYRGNHCVLTQKKVSANIFFLSPIYSVTYFYWNGRTLCYNNSI